MTDTTWSTTDYFGSSVGVFTNGNLSVDRTGGANWITGRATNSRNTLKRHWEITPNNLPWWNTGSQARIAMGILDGTKNLAGTLWEIGDDANGRALMPNGLTRQCSGLVMPWLGSGSTVALEYDSVAQKLWFGMNGFCTWNPNTWFSNSLASISGNGGLTIERNGGGTNWVGGTATAFGATGGYGSGKLMFEVTYTSGTPGSNIIIGAATSAVNFTGSLTFPGNDTTKGFGYQSNGSTFGCGGITMPSCAVGDKIAVVLDYTNGKGWLLNSSNGLWNNDVIGNQNPATNTGGFTLPSGTLLPSCAFFASSILLTLNAGSSAFTTTLPSGFSAYEPGTFKWNNDVIANQNPATATGGISTSGIATTSIYPAWSCHDSASKQTADFDASTFVFAPSAGFVGWDGRQAPAVGPSNAAVTIICG